MRIVKEEALGNVTVKIAKTGLVPGARQKEV